MGLGAEKWTYLSGVNVNHVKVHGDQRPEQEQQNCKPKPAGIKVQKRVHDKPGPGPSGLSDQEKGFRSYMVVQMLTIMKKKAVIS